MTPELQQELVPPAPPPRSVALVEGLRWLGRYFLPHLAAMAGGVAFTWGVRWLSSFGGACRIFCYPPITITLGLLGGFIGAQLYRLDHPVPRRRG